MVFPNHITYLKTYPIYLLHTPFSNISLFINMALITKTNAHILIPTLRHFALICILWLILFERINKHDNQFNFFFI